MCIARSMSTFAGSILRIVRRISRIILRRSPKTTEVPVIFESLDEPTRRLFRQAFSAVECDAYHDLDKLIVGVRPRNLDAFRAALEARGLKDHVFAMGLMAWLKEEKGFIKYGR